MIAVPAGVKVLVATKPVDFRKGGDGLVALVRETLGQDPFSGTIFIFRVEASGPCENRGLGRIRTGAVLEAAGARRIPVATDQRRRDAVDRIATRRAR